MRRQLDQDDIRKNLELFGPVNARSIQHDHMNPDTMGLAKTR